MTRVLAHALVTGPDAQRGSQPARIGHEFRPIGDADSSVDVGAIAPGDVISPYLTLAEVSRLLRLNERTIRRMIAARRLPCVRIGRQIRFAPAALSRWLQAREEG